MSKKYSLTETQIRHLAIIAYREQGGSMAGVKACLSHMCNYYEKYRAKDFPGPYECTIKSGWYWKEAKNMDWIANHPTVPQQVVNAVRDVIVNGGRTLPEYVDEYDCLTDVRLIINDGVTHTMGREKAYVMNRYNYVKDRTIIENVYADGSADRYRFYCFPDGPEGSCDAFGYLSKPASAANSSSQISSQISQNQAGNVQGSSQNCGTAAQNCTTTAQIQAIIEKATRWMEDLASDDSHGYDQAYRWGERGDFDCSSAVISAWQNAGVCVKSAGATYTGNMHSVFTRCGFTDVTGEVNLKTGAGLKRGDVLLNHQKHTAMYCGNNLQVDAIGNENNGAATGGKPGDQTGREILVREYRGSYAWDCVLRYTGTVGNISTSQVVQAATQAAQNIRDKVSVTVDEVAPGTTGASTLLAQRILASMGYKGSDGKDLELDGECGANTTWAIRCFQSDHGLEMDGIAGKKTLAKLMEGLTA